MCWESEREEELERVVGSWGWLLMRGVGVGTYLRVNYEYDAYG